jgi:hypothetical protein
MRKLIGTAVVIGVAYFLYTDWKAKQEKTKVTVKNN